MGASPSTTSTMQSFDSLAKKYYSNPEVVKCVESYEMAGTPMILEDGSNVHGTVGGGDNKGIPVFDFIPFKMISEGGTLILQEEGPRSKEIIKVFIPAGFKNGSICNDMQPYDSNISESGLSSFWHLLAITDKPSYCNAVTIRKYQLDIIRDKKDLLHKAMGILLKGSESDIGSLKWLRNLSGNVTLEDGSEVSVKPTEELLSESCQDNFETFDTEEDITDDILSNIGYFYHAFDQATVFSGHMHAVAIDYKTKCFDLLEAKAKESGVDKNIPVDEIIEYVEAGKLDELKLQAIMKN